MNPISRWCVTIYQREPPKSAPAKAIGYTKPPNDKPDDYHCVIVDPGIDADTFITGYDIRPGEGRIVHHVAFFALSGEKVEAEAAALDAAEEGPGYTCFGGAGHNRATL